MQPLIPHWTFKHEQALRAIGDYANGATIKRAVAECGLSWAWFWQLVSDDADLRALYEKARLARVEAMAGEILDEADNPNTDPARARNRMQARQWLMSKWLPAIYGDKMQVEQEVGPNMARIIALGMQRAGLSAPTLTLDQQRTTPRLSDISTLAHARTDAVSVDQRMSEQKPLSDQEVMSWD